MFTLNLFPLSKIKNVTFKYGVEYFICDLCLGIIYVWGCCCLDPDRGRRHFCPSAVDKLFKFSEPGAGDSDPSILIFHLEPLNLTNFPPLFFINR